MAIEVASLKATVGLDNSNLRRDATEARSLIRGVGDTFAGVAKSAAASAAGFLIRDIVVGSVTRLKEAVTGLGRELVDANAAWETYIAQFTVQLGSQEAALRRLGELREFAIFAPGGLEDMIRADLILQNFGLHAEDAAERWGYSGEQIRSIAADVAAATSASFEDISLWLGRFAAGDTGRAIMRMQELGVVTRQQLQQMGVEFSKAGSLVTPVDEAFSVMLRLIEEKYGGLMQLHSRTLSGMREQLEDWKAQETQLWGQPVFDLYKEGLSGLLGFLDSEAIQEAMRIGRELWTSLVEWIGDVARDWAAGLGSLAAEAFNWGANIVEQFAYGIAGSDAVASALRGIAAQIAYWLSPGSPPRILPEIDKWGAGALDAWLGGWDEASTGIGIRLKDTFKSLEPHLREIDRSGVFDMGRFREGFGATGASYEPYMRAYASVVQAVHGAAEAREALSKAETAGDEEAVAAAKEKVEAADAQERTARQQLSTEQRRIAERMRQEQQLARAIQQQTRAVQERAKVEADAAAKAAEREAEAERRRQEAEAKKVADARLRWELAQADTEGQIAIWERELAGVAEDTAEWYDISTTIINLQQRLERELASAVKGAAGGVGGDVSVAESARKVGETIGQHLAAGFGGTPLFADALNDYFDPESGKINWGQIGKAIAGAVWDGFKTWAVQAGKDAMFHLSEALYAWTGDTANLANVHKAGADLGGAIGAGIIGLFTSPEDIEVTAAGMESHLQIAALKAGASAWQIGVQLGQSVIAGMASNLPWVTGDADEVLATMRMSPETLFAHALPAKLFGSPEEARRVVENFLTIATDPDEIPSVRASAEQLARGWATQFGLTVEEVFTGDPTAPFRVWTAEEVSAAEASGRTISDAWADEFVAQTESTVTSGLTDTFENLSAEDAKAAGETSGTAFSGGFVAKLWDGLKGINAWLEKWGPFGTGLQDMIKPGATSTGGKPLGLTVGNALGTSFWPGGWSWVGEQGPELMRLPAGSQVRSAEDSQRMAGGATSITINVNAPGGDPRQVEVGVRRALAAAGVGY